VNASLFGVVAATLAILAFLWGVARWTFKVDMNTRATDRLTQAFERHAGRTDETLNDHERRITSLEDSRD
jgi:hypothetical protein